MTPTAAPTDTQSDPREVPGGGKLKPVTHIVRIVVVPHAAGSAPAVHSDGPGQSHVLTKDELETTEAFLQTTNAPASWDATSGPPQSANMPPTKPKKMLDVLKPTDIVVIGPEPASVRSIDSSGKPSTALSPASQQPEPKPTKKLFPHDDHNRDTVLRVWTESDKIEYQCDQEFEILQVDKAGWKLFGAPDNPFERERGATPYKATKERTSTIDAAGNPEFVWKWTSGVLSATADNQQYKATFKIGGQRIDPDVVCGDPPPAP
jgi:hypothetical protein